MSDPSHTNRLARETSPYLLQHAHNPVDWYAWGPEAFAAARAADKPIFLSVGYSTCYWCHVMERQCFENEEIARQMNDLFVSIKVDREERPDVDQLYMLAVQLMTRQGGWPMSVFLTPDLRPFYGGTYFPPQDMHGRPGFPTILSAIDNAYRDRKTELSQSADRLVNTLRQIAQPRPAKSPFRIDRQWIAQMIARSTADFEPMHGGFGSAPKFPRQTLLELILVYLGGEQQPSAAADDLAELRQQLHFTLDAMAHGGIRDQLGGAFHRYSTDEQWLVPHFEIMLYDNAMLLWIYTEAHRQSGDARYAAVARGIADFILAEMTSPDGGFYTALDAEVDAQEGASYLWTMDEADAALAGHATEAQIARFCRVYGLDAGPNFADPHHGGGAPEKNVLFLADPGDQDHPSLLDPRLAELRKILYTARRGRKQPMLDTKILTSWNALMVRGLAHAGQILGEARYVAAASKCADYLLSFAGADGSLPRVCDARKIPGFLDDYAFFAQALLALGRDEQARLLAKQMQARFGDEQGGFFYTDRNAEDLIVRQKVAADSPLPSGNAVAAMVMLQLDQPRVAAETITAFAGQLQDLGESMSAMIQAALRYQRIGPLQIGGGEIPQQLSPQEQASAAVQIRTVWSNSNQLDLHVSVDPAFHLTASHLRCWSPDATAVEYPQPARRRFSYSDEELSVYEGEFVVTVRFSSPPVREVQIMLSYQPCTQDVCLAAVIQRITAGPPGT
jgi:uncharacterized protein YyaL (SSP411 family)